MFMNQKAGKMKAPIPTTPSTYRGLRPVLSESAEEYVGHERDQGRYHDDAEDHATGHAYNVRGVRVDVGDKDQGDRVLDEEGATDEEHLLGVGSEHVDYGRSGLRARLLDALEGWALHDPKPNEEPYPHEDHAEKERQTPAPGQERSFREQRDEKERQGRQHGPGRGPRLGPAAVKAAPVRG